MAEEENIAAELHGHFTQSLRTAMSGGLQMMDQAARRREKDAETQRRTEMDTARQLVERNRAIRDSQVAAEGAAALRDQVMRDQVMREEALRVERDGRDRDVGGQERAHADAPTAFPVPIATALGAPRDNDTATARTCHERERGLSRSSVEVGR